MSTENLPTPTEILQPLSLHQLNKNRTELPKAIQQYDLSLLRQTALTIKNIPKRLIHSSNWLLWKPEYHATKIDKVIKKPLGGKKWPNKIRPFQEVLKQYSSAIQKHPVGLGYAFNKKHPYIVIDIDSLQSPINGKLINELNSYTEYSPSLKGVHIWLSVDSTETKKKIEKQFGSKQFSTKNKRDLFISSGYVTITGNQYKKLATDNNKSFIKTFEFEELYPILSKYFNPKIRDLTTIAEIQRENDKNNPLQIKKYSPGQSKHPASRLTTEVVRKLLKKINVKTLTEGIFEKVNHPTKLAILDPECTEEARTPWITICQAVHHNFNGDQNGLLLLHEWSKNGNKYNKDDLNSVYVSFSTEPQFLNQTNPVTIASLISLVKAQNPEFPDTSPKGKPLSTLENLYTYFKFFKYQFKYNLITYSTEAVVPDFIAKSIDLPSAKIDSIGKITRIVASELLKLNFSNSQFQSLEGSIEDYAKKFSYNPIKNYFEKLADIYDPEATPFEDLLGTIKLQEHATSMPNAKAIGLFIRKWLIQVAAAACASTTHSNKIFNNLLIFTGAQGIGKTLWVQSIFPKAIKQYCAGSGSLNIHSFRSDRVKQAIELQGTLICNINEIDLLFKQRSYSAFKQLLDESTSKMVMPYGREATTVIRRTVFIGSTNKTDFLVDQTGNRRITIIPAAQLDYKHSIDLDQLWAHVMHWYKSDEKWWLDVNIRRERKAIEVQNALNNQNMYMGDEFLIEDFDAYFNTEEDKSIHYNKWTFKQVRQVVPSLSQLKVNSSNFKEARSAFINWLKQTKHGKVLKKASVKRAPQFYLVPPLRSSDTAVSFRQIADIANQSQ